MVRPTPEGSGGIERRVSPRTRGTEPIRLTPERIKPPKGWRNKSDPGFVLHVISRDSICNILYSFFNSQCFQFRLEFPRFYGHAMTDELKASLITLRSAVPDDEAFLYQLYASTRSEEMRAWGLGAPQQETILKLQFTAQRRHYEIAFPHSDHKIILCDGRPAGRILVFRSEHEIRLVDIALLTEHRGAGIGGSLIRALIQEAQAAGKRLVLHVEKQNRAARLYERLGFSTTADTGGHIRMEFVSRREDG